MAPKPVWQLQDQRRAECGSRPVQKGCDRQVILRLVDGREEVGLPSDLNNTNSRLALPARNADVISTGLLQEAF